MIKEFKLKKKELELENKELIKLKIAELELLLLEKENEKLKGKKESIPKEPIPERHMEAIKELIKIHAANGVSENSIQTYIATYRKDYDLTKKCVAFPHALFKQVFEENTKEKPKPSPTPSPEKSPAAEAEAGAEV